MDVLRLNTELAELIRDAIRARGPQSFAWFMEQALYHPRHGYYSSGRAAIGRKGDYFTSVSAGPVFGQLLVAQFAEIWERLGRIDNFVIVEQGAHDGQFARDVLESAEKVASKFFGAMRYRIVEPFPVWRDRQRQTLESFHDKVEWRNSLEPFVGIHFSNELLDAMPVDLPGKLVDLDGAKLVFVKNPAHEQARFNQAALEWIDNVATNLQRGYIIAVDYGHIGDDFVPTVQARAQHRHLDSPFEQIGHADITAHVDWISIADRARRNGLSIAGFTDQHHFLTGILSASPPADLSFGGLLDLTALSGQVGAGRKDEKAKRELQTLLHPEMLGRSFQVLALGRDVDAGTPLAGFKFARDTDL